MSKNSKMEEILAEFLSQQLDTLNKLKELQKKVDSEENLSYLIEVLEDHEGKLTDIANKSREK